jgi:hypothetical protein
MKLQDELEIRLQKFQIWQHNSNKSENMKKKNPIPGTWKTIPKTEKW